MLRNVTNPNATTRLFLALRSSVGAQSAVAVNVRCYSSSESRSNSGSSPLRSRWVPLENRRGSVPPDVHRPHVNGRPVAFHVSDLRLATFNTGNSRQQQPPKQQSQHLKTNSKQYESDLVVVLDMDECLIHSQFLSNPAAAKVYAHQLLQQRRNQSSLAAASGSCNTFRLSLVDGEMVHVHVRPGLEEFLAEVTSRFETHIFTAALPIYADAVLNRLDPDGSRFAGRWYRDSCIFDAPPQGTGAYVKDLSRLPTFARQLNRVVLVDNNPLSFLANPNNGILVDHFYTNPADKSLPKVLELLGELDKLPDVRPFLDQRFAIEKSLQAVYKANNDNSVGFQQMAKAA